MDQLGGSGGSSPLQLARGQFNEARGGEGEGGRLGINPALSLGLLRRGYRFRGAFPKS